MQSIRLSLWELEDHPMKKNDFLKAWDLIKKLPAENPNSFWSIATYHGMPFKDRQVEPLDPPTSFTTWGGYCQHANVLFPLWHRFYCLKLEEALQAVLPDGDVALHYWDQTSYRNLEGALPPILTDETVTIDGKDQANPLLNFQIPLPIGKSPDGSADEYYIKEVGYTTVRYPFSGISNPKAAKKIADAHNAKIERMNKPPVDLLKTNLIAWLNRGIVKNSKIEPNSIHWQYSECLSAPNYNKFSNVTSSKLGLETYESLEEPHNSIHLAVGGFTTPVENDDGSVKVDKDGCVQYYGLLEGANGDMGENETASFDPIFFLHHCNVDRMFWVWQKKSGKTDNLQIYQERGKITGTNTAGQGPTPDQKPGQHLTMDTILYPFQSNLGVPRAGKDCINIHNLGYDYSIGSLDESDVTPHLQNQHTSSFSVDNLRECQEKLANEHELHPGVPLRVFFDVTNARDNFQTSWYINTPLFMNLAEEKINFKGKEWKRRFFLKVKNLNKDENIGSFVVQAFYKKDEKLFFLGQRGILSRWQRKYCPNCNVRNKAAVSMFVSNEITEYVFTEDNLKVHILRKDPQSGNSVITNIDIASEDLDRPQIQKLVSFERDA